MIMTHAAALNMQKDETALPFTLTCFRTASLTASSMTGSSLWAARYAVTCSLDGTADDIFSFLRSASQVACYRDLDAGTR